MTGRIMHHLILTAAIALGAINHAYAETFTLAVQPILPAAQTAKAYKPLSDYLAKKTGHKFELVTSPNFLAYWQEMKKGQYHFVIDGAHLTDYRIQKLGYKPLVKVLDVVSFSLVTGPDTLVFEATELVGKPVATLASPSAGALIIEQLFNHPIRQPVPIEVTNAQEAVNKVLSNEVNAAIIPTPMVGANPDLNVVTTTDQFPHIAISASRTVTDEVASAVTKAMLEASETPDGQQMLSKINFPGFEKATAELYHGRSDILKSVWGY